MDRDTPPITGAYVFVNIAMFISRSVAVFGLKPHPFLFRCRFKQGFGLRCPGRSRHVPGIAQKTIRVTLRNLLLLCTIDRLRLLFHKTLTFLYRVEDTPGRMDVGIGHSPRKLSENPQSV